MPPIRYRLRERFSATASTSTTQDDNNSAALSAEIDMPNKIVTSSQATICTALGSNTTEGGTSTSHSYDSMPTTGSYRRVAFLYSKSCFYYEFLNIKKFN